MKVRWERFVARPEVENSALAAIVTAAASEDLAAREPAHEDQRIWLRNVEAFAVHFLVLNLNRFAQPLGDGVTRLDNPHPFVLPAFHPLLPTACSPHPLHDPTHLTH